jgi:flagellar biosynthetic protein FliQ
MEPEISEMMDLGREAIWVLIKISLPVMLVALFVGLGIALFQALTQVQEATLSFVPKIIAIFFALLVFLPFIFQTLKVFNDHIHQYIQLGGGG